MTKKRQIESLFLHKEACLQLLYHMLWLYFNEKYVNKKIKIAPNE